MNQDDKKLVTEFFEFVSEYEFKLTAPPEEVQAEIKRLANEKWWAAKTEFAKGALELIRTGVKYSDLISFIAQSFRIDPNEGIRALTDSSALSPTQASPTDGPD